MSDFTSIIRPLFRDHVYAGRSLLFLEETKSTNLLCLNTPELLRYKGLVVRARRQTGGIGRKGRRWEEGNHENLFCSFVLEPPDSIKGKPALTLLIGLAVSKALEKMGAQRESLSIKWPNDILLKERKVGGILCQSAWFGDSHVVVAGIGMNVKGDVSQFPPELSRKATTLEQHGLTVDAHTLLLGLCVEIEGIMDQAARNFVSQLLEQWRARAECIGRKVTFEEGGNRLQGVITDVDPDGRLVVTDASSAIHLVESGEIEFIYS